MYHSVKCNTVLVQYVIKHTLHIIYHIMLCHVIPLPYHTIHYHSMPYHTIPYCFTPHHTITYYTIAKQDLKKLIRAIYIEKFVTNSFFFCFSQTVLDEKEVRKLN